MLPSATTPVTTTQELKGTKICRFQHEATKTRVFLKLIAKKEKHVMYVDSGRAMAAMSI